MIHQLEAVQFHNKVTVAAQRLYVTYKFPFICCQSINSWTFFFKKNICQKSIFWNFSSYLIPLQYGHRVQQLQFYKKKVIDALTTKISNLIIVCNCFNIRKTHFGCLTYTNKICGKTVDGLTMMLNCEIYKWNDNNRQVTSTV